MSRNIRKKTDIPVPEPRHRVGPKGISSGISFRDLPPPSLDEIKHVCEHYKVKCAGTYKSLASRYVYQMATEIDQLVDALKEGGFVSQESDLTIDDRGFHESPCEVNPRSKNRPSVSSQSMHNLDMTNASSFHDNRHGPRPHTASAHRKPSQRPHYRRTTRESPRDSVDEESDETPALKQKHYRSSRPRRNNDSLAHLNLEDQNEEVLRWLKEEMRRSQSLIDRSKQMHDAELVGAKKEVEKVKKAAKVLIKAVKKGKDQAEKSEAIAETERRRRLRSQQMLESLIKSHNTQIDLLKEGLCRDLSRDAGKSLRDQARFHPWGELQDDRTDVSFSRSDASDETTVLDDHNEEAY